MSPAQLTILKDALRGPILRIKDPLSHDIEAIMSSYFREILWLARRYSRPSVEYEDLVVEGLMGLLDAIKRWDPKKAKGNPKAFHNLAVVRIKSNMFEYFLSNNTRYTVPNYMARAITLVDQARNLIDSREYGGDSRQALVNMEDREWKESVPEELQKEVASLKAKIGKLARNAGKTYSQMVSAVLKIQENITDYENGTSKFERDISPEEEAAQAEFLTKFLNALNPDARDVLTFRLQGLTLEEVGAKKGFTRERARQIEEETLGYFQETRMFRDAVEDTMEA